jgi:hypothetical protein
MLSRIKHLKVFLKDPDKKNLLTILKECLVFGLIKKSLPTDYFRKFLYRKDIKNYKDYLSMKEYYSIIESPQMVYPEISHLLTSKLSFKIIAAKYKLKTQELLSYNVKTHFFCDTKHKIVDTQEQLIHFFKNQFETSGINSIFLKPVSGIGGFGCFLIQKETFEAQIKTYSETLLNKSYIHEAFIDQHPEIKNIYANAVNTLRIVHYTDTLKKIHILSTFMRFGIGKSITDNTSDGGFFISVNHETGMLEGIGRQEITRGAGTFTRHPNTLVKLEGFQVPFYKEACDMVKAYATIFPNRIVGWDIAITANGPLMIEGNHNPGLHVSDMAYGGYLKNKYIKEILTELK